MIRCISPYRASYRQAIVELKPGDEIEDQALAAHVLNDSPESFEVVGAPAPAAPAEPEPITEQDPPAAEPTEEQDPPAAEPVVTTHRATKPTTNKREA